MFDDSSDSEAEPSAKKSQNGKAVSNGTSNKINTKSGEDDKKKFNLIGSDSEGEAKDDEAFQMFESKINLDEKQANKVILSFFKPSIQN